MKHYVCRACGNLVAMINDTGRRIGCCSRDMEELVPGVVDASREKHTPIIEKKGDVVTVKVGRGDNAHPMLPEHAVAWVCLVTTAGSQRRILRPDGHSEAKFLLVPGEHPIKAFAYCNLHGLWVAEVVNGDSSDKSSGEKSSDKGSEKN